VKLGPKATEQMTRLASTWKQGEHIVVSGATGSGKTALVRYLDEIRIQRNGHVVVFVGKVQEDDTIRNDYRGWTRWKKWKKNPSPHDKRILLWPDVRGKNPSEAKIIQAKVFSDALNEIFKSGRWTVHLDEGMYMTSPMFMNLAETVAIMHAMGRSSMNTLITLIQRPAHVPLIIYSSASHAFIGRTREGADLKRVAELGGRESSKELSDRIAAQGQHDFLWVPVAPDWPAETVNLRF